MNDASSQKNLAIVVPTLNPGRLAGLFVAALCNQSNWPMPLLVIDSSSDDGSPERFAQVGARILQIPRAEFDHGGTRQLAIDASPGSDVIVFLTQDAILADARAISALLAAFDDPAVGMAYGRQLPHPDAGPFGAFARRFNYPEQSVVRSISDGSRYGLKTIFVSNSFAAYRRSALQAVGGFPSNTIFGEDTIVAARMLMAGLKVAYVAEACVYHSHDYTLADEFRRYFDIGVLHSRESWLRATFGQAEGEGGRYVRAELRYLREHAPWLIPVAFLRNGLKYFGYRLGMLERHLPIGLKRRISMHRRYWST